MHSAYYFGAGPAAFPLEVLQAIQAEFLDWQGTGLSILELGHRTTIFEDMMARLEKKFRDLAHIPSEYEVIFTGASTRAHFGWIPLNFLRPHETAGYWITGQWSQVAYQEAVKLKKAYTIASTASTNFNSTPDPTTWQFQDNTAYVYYTPNETIHGVRFMPDLSDLGVPVIADMTSCLLTEALEVAAYDCIIAGAQKNLANAGLSIAILKKTFLEKMQDDTVPTLSDYRTYVSSHSLYTTPPTFNCYVMLKMLDWLQAQGGVAAIADLNRQKAQALYTYIDHSDFYENHIEQNARSTVNIPFGCRDKSLEPAFLAAAQARGLLGLNGHRLVGGMRASLYNAIPLAGVHALIECMQDFKQSHV